MNGYEKEKNWGRGGEKGGRRLRANEKRKDKKWQWEGGGKKGRKEEGGSEDRVGKKRRRRRETKGKRGMKRMGRAKNTPIKAK